MKKLKKNLKIKLKKKAKQKQKTEALHLAWQVVQATTLPANPQKASCGWAIPRGLQPFWNTGPTKTLREVLSSFSPCQIPKRCLLSGGENYISNWTAFSSSIPTPLLYPKAKHSIYLWSFPHLRVNVLLSEDSFSFPIRSQTDYAPPLPV